MRATGLKLTNALDEDVVLPERATPEERMHPPGGWDDPRDVQAAISICEGLKFYILKDEASEVRCFDLAVRMYNQGISRRTARVLIKKHAAAGLSPDNIRLQIDRAYSVAHHPPGENSLAKPRDDDGDWLKIEEDDPEDLSWLEGGHTNWPRPVAYDTGKNNASVLRQFLEMRPGKIISSDGVIYSLNDETKIWEAITADALAAEMRATDPGLTLDTSKIRRIVDCVHVENFTAAKPFDWLDAPHDAPAFQDLALFSNGVLSVSEMKLLPHGGHLLATGFPDFKYDPEAQCPRWDTFLHEVLDESFHETLMEFFGYCMVPDIRYEKLLALVGARRGGKSTALRVLSWLVGPAHVTSRTLNDLAGEFALEGTQDKKLLLIPDASDTEVSKRGTALDRIKAISGGDEVSVNRKNSKIVTGHIPARLAFSANRHPRFLDDSGALASRELLVIFERTFEGREDRDLSAKLKAELSGIANRAIAALRRLRENGGRFTVGVKGAAAHRDLQASQSPALRFARAHIIVTGNPDDRLSLPEVFERYEAWATDESLGPRERRSREDFKNDLIAAIGHRGVIHARRRWHDPARPRTGEGRITRGFFGIKLKM